MLNVIKSLVVTRNWLSNFKVKLDSFLMSSNIHQSMSKIPRIIILCLIFSLASVVVELLNFCDFPRNKSCKTYHGSMLPPGCRNWQLIFPIRTFCRVFYAECRGAPQISIQPRQLTIGFYDVLIH